MITDFGISRIVVNSMTIAGPTSVKGNARWMAPELLGICSVESTSVHEAHTKATDVWAFGMVVYVRIDEDPTDELQNLIRRY